MKQIFPIINDVGLFLGVAWGYDTTIRPGVILPPVGSVDAPVPEIPEDHDAFWDGALPWRFVARPAPEPDPEPAPLTEAQAIALIDTGADAIVRATIGDRGEEYSQAEADAQAFAAAAYTGDVPLSIAIWAQTSGMSSQAATDDILAQAEAWRGALMQIRAARLQAKATARDGDIESAIAAWNTFDAQIRTALGIAGGTAP